MYYKPVDFQKMDIDKWLNFYDNIPREDKSKPITTEILERYMFNTYMATPSKKLALEFIFWDEEKYVEFCLQWM